MSEPPPAGPEGPRLLPDWPIYRTFYTDAAIAAVASQDASIEAWLRFEQAVAMAQAALGIVPAEAAAAIAALSPGDLDLSEFSADTAAVGRPIVPLVRAIRGALPDIHGRHVHHGLTTQDVMDTGHALLLRDGAAIVARRLDAAIVHLSAIARAHASTPMLGRTIGQAARPTTFGFRVVVWAAELARHRDRLVRAVADAARVQLGGPVGTLAGQNGRGRELRTRVAEMLGLGVDAVTTQSARDCVIAFLLALANLGASVDKIARELAFLAASGIGEIRFEQPSGTGVSSAMPHKANPSLLEFAEACGSLARTRGASALDAAAHRGDREGGVWLREWPTLIETLHYAAASLGHLGAALNVLAVDEAGMAAALGHLPPEARAGDDIGSATSETLAALSELARGRS